MRNQARANQHPDDATKGAASPPAGTGPGGRTLSSEAVQYWIDRAAHFNIFSIPESGASSVAILAPGNSASVIGMRINEVLHRFSIQTELPSAQTPVRARNIVGEAAGKFSHRWIVIPEDFVALPDREPPATVFDPLRSQRFVMLDSLCTFGDGSDGFRGFGTGQTWPTTINGQPQILAAAVGTILEGFGKFKGHEGTYAYCGTLSPQHGFTGNLLLRVADASELFCTDNALPVLETRVNPDPDTVYVLFRGQAVPADSVTPSVGAAGRPTGLIVEQGLRLLEIDFKAGGHSGLKSTARVGPLIGRITAHVTFDPSAPGGTALDPIPFTSYDEFVFFNHEGQKVGAFTGNSTEGRVFHTQVAGLSGIRFGGIGHILNGTGPFEGINGLLTDNSVVLFSPHVSASLYLLRIYDPDGRFRAAIRC